MTTIKLISLIAMAALYILAGIGHFVKPKVFLKITPKWVPYPEKVNILVGIIEILLGVALLFSETRYFGALGIIALLIAVFPANIYHFQQARKKGKFVTQTLIRLPIQLILIYWAYSFL
ncbi:MAG: DoxX family protein [Saprospiraceae bacterium]|nr:DoxX family protein [Saprospiraceae bacterium]